MAAGTARIIDDSREVVGEVACKQQLWNTESRNGFRLAIFFFQME